VGTLNRRALYCCIMIQEYSDWYTGLLHLVQRGGAWAGCGPAQSPPRCTKCNSPPINDQCTAVPTSHYSMWRYYNLPPTTEEVNAIARDVCLSVCPSVCLCVCLLARLLKKRVHGFGWHFACRQVSRHGRTDQLLSAIRIIVRMPEPDCFLRYRMHCNAKFYYVWKIPRAWFGAREASQWAVAAAMRGFEASKHRCRR